MRSIRRSALLTLIIAVAVGVQPAAASPVDLVCPFTATASFAPGVTLGARPVAITGVTALGTAAPLLAPCSSPLTGVPFTAGTGQVSASGTLACVILGNNLTGGVTGTIAQSWNNGETSTISFSVLSVGPVPVFSASVTDGALRGSNVTVIPGPTGLTGNCLLSPATSLSFAGVLIISRL